jgi:hypothetical protein
LARRRFLNPRLRFSWPAAPCCCWRCTAGARERRQARYLRSTDLGFAAADIGKINVGEMSTYVAVARAIAPQVQRKLAIGRIKGRSVKAREGASLDIHIKLHIVSTCDSVLIPPNGRAT